MSIFFARIDCYLTVVSPRAIHNVYVNEEKEYYIPSSKSLIKWRVYRDKC